MTGTGPSPFGPAELDTNTTPAGLPKRPRRRRPNDVVPEVVDEEFQETQNHRLRELEDPPPATFSEVLNPGSTPPRMGGYAPSRRSSGSATEKKGRAASAAATAASAANAAASAGEAAITGSRTQDGEETDRTTVLPVTKRKRDSIDGRSKGRGRRTAEQARVTAGQMPSQMPPAPSPELPEETTRLISRVRDRGPANDRTVSGPIPRPSAPADEQDAAQLVAEPSLGRAGRDLPAAIAVGVLLSGLALASLFTRPEAFVALASLVVVLAVWELAGAMAAKAIIVPVIPLAVGAVGMLVSAYVAGEEGLLISFALTGVGVLLWRILEGVPGASRDVTAGIFTAAYVPLLAGFAVLLLADRNGPLRVVTFIVVTVSSDIGGYVAGVLAGKHPMAPTISPRKSWEGFAGSVITCLICGTAFVYFLLDGRPWVGLALGAAAAVTATIGDLSESLIKRDLGVKDMGSLLPGHGGIMDRLDSLLPTAPIAFLILHFLVT